MNAVANAIVKVATRFFARRCKQQQQRSELWDPSHWGAATNEKGHLTLDGVDLVDVMQQCGSPLFVVSNDRLVSDVLRFLDKSLQYFPDSQVSYSFKTNCIPGVLQRLSRFDLGAEVISDYELSIAERLGYTGDRIVVNGVNKTREYIHRAIRLGVSSINIDDKSELPLIFDIARQTGKKVRVCLRLRLNRSSHFGLSVESGDAARVAAEIAEHPSIVEFTGLHFHLLASNQDPEPHIKYLRRGLAFAAEIQRRFGLRTRQLSLGGGFSVATVKVTSRFEYARQRFLGVPPTPPDPSRGIDLDHYFSQLASAFEKCCRRHALEPPTILFEPGRIVTSNSHVLLSNVHSVKATRNGPDFVMTDAGRLLTSYPCDYEYHQMFLANRMQEHPSTNYHLMGRLCTGTDWLAKFRCLPDTKSGDVVAIMDAGAYFWSYSSNFGFPRPAVVLLTNGTAVLLRKEENYDHFSSLDVGID